MNFISEWKPNLKNIGYYVISTSFVTYVLNLIYHWSNWSPGNDTFFSSINFHLDPVIHILLAIFVTSVIVIVFGIIELIFENKKASFRQKLISCNILGVFLLIFFGFFRIT